MLWLKTFGGGGAAGGGVGWRLGGRIGDWHCGGGGGFVRETQLARRGMCVSGHVGMEVCMQQ